MSYTSYGLNNAILHRARRSRNKGIAAGVKRWARHGLTKITRAQARGEVQEAQIELAVEGSTESGQAAFSGPSGNRLRRAVTKLRTVSDGIAEVRVKGQRGRRFIGADAFTSPSDFHLSQMGFAKDTGIGEVPDFASFAEEAWDSRFSMHG